MHTVRVVHRSAPRSPGRSGGRTRLKATRYLIGPARSAGRHHSHGGDMRSVLARLRPRLRRPSRHRDDDVGMATAEYAVGLVVAATFGLVLYKIVTGGQISSLLANIVKRALSVLT